jgi:hypothetical protein
MRARRECLVSICETGGFSRDIYYMDNFLRHNHPVMKPPTHGPGRPRKYGRPSHAVTVTLPDDVVAGLIAVDADLGRAIVSLVERQAPAHGAAARSAEVASYGNHAVIVVNPGRALKRLPGVQLVPAGNGRALISLDRPNQIPRLELDVRDAIEATDISRSEREALESIADILHRARHSKGLALKERSIIVLESKRQRRRNSGATAAVRRPHRSRETRKAR